MKRSLLKSLSMRSFAILIAVGGTLGTPAGHVAALPDEPAAAPTRQARQTLLATAQNGQVLLAMDIDNRTSTVIGNTGVAPASLALAISPDKTTAYTVATTQNPSEAHLAKIDLAPGAETLVGDTG